MSLCTSRLSHAASEVDNVLVQKMKKRHLNQYSVNMVEQSPKSLVICDKDINNSHCQHSLSSDLPVLHPSGCFSLIFSLEREQGLNQDSL